MGGGGGGQAVSMVGPRPLDPGFDPTPSFFEENFSFFKCTLDTYFSKILFLE